MNRLSQNILKQRKAANLTQEQLAAELGVTPQSVSNWERGGAPDISLLPVLANFFSVTIDELMGNSTENVQEQKKAFWRELNNISDSEELLNRLLDEYRKFPHDCLIMHRLMHTIPQNRKENIVFIEELCEKLLSESNDPDLRESAISLMARISRKEEREKWLSRLPRRMLCRQQIMRKWCLIQDGDVSGAAKQSDILAVIQIDEFCENLIPDGIDTQEKEKRIRKQIAVLESLRESGTLPDAWLSLYAYKTLVLSACLFGSREEKKYPEAWQCFEVAISCFEKWFTIPDAALLSTGFGEVRLTKDRKFAVHSNGTREYIAYCTSSFGRITPDYLLNSCLKEQNRWAWFNPVRNDAQFVETVKRIETYMG